MQRIVVVGTTGSGKTQLARKIAERLGVPHVELDALHWEAGWTMPPTPVFRERITQALAGDAWVADGNYGKVRDLVWSRADTLVWLDYPLRLSLWRLLRRTAHRVRRREMLWGGNRETWRNVLFSRDSLFLWAVTTHGRHRREYQELPRHPEYAHLRVVRLRTPRQAKAWLAAVPAGVARSSASPHAFLC